ncbi:MAG: DUF2339 domain-containing protein, partial [Polyangiaceae bacterium]
QEILRLGQQVAWLEGWLRSLSNQLQRESEERARLAAPSPKIEEPQPTATPIATGAETPIATAAQTPIATAAEIPREAAPPAVAAAPAAIAVDAAPDVAAEPAPMLVEPAPTLEEQLGIVWLTRIGAAVFVVGALFFFKYAVDNAWIGPMGRVAIGAIIGIALLIGAEASRPKTKASFVAALTGIGLAVLFASVWASSAFYDLVSPTVAFVANTAVLFLGAALSVRHRAETTLVVSLAAGFLNPVVLSTGRDQPVALFTYLVLITSVALAVSSTLRIPNETPDAPNGFRATPWLLVIGTIVIFVGWYGKFFDISDRRNLGIDAPAETLIGAYFPLIARVAPIAFVFVTAAEWIAAAFQWRARHREGKIEIALAVTALVAGHVGSTLLLYDSPRAFGVAAIALGVGSIVVLKRLRATHLLLVPMGAAFVALLGVSGHVDPSARVTLIAVLGGWAGVYVVGLLRDSEISRVAARRASIALASFSCLAAVVLVDASPTFFTLVIAGVMAVAAALAIKSDDEVLLAVASVVTVGFVSLAAGVLGYRSADVPWRLLGAACLAFAVILAASAIALRKSLGPWTLLAISAATLGFTGAVVLATWSEVPELRALAAAASGCVDLGIGAWIIGKKRDSDRHYANALVGQALALFATSIAFSQTGATITVLWAALAVVATVAAAKTRDAEWLAIAVAFYAVTVGRALFVDTFTTYRLTETFLSTMGRDGEIAVSAFRNPRAYGLFSSGLALLIGARLIAKAPPRALENEGGPPIPIDTRPMAAAMAILAYVLLIAMLIVEVRVAATKLPPAPGVPLDMEEWQTFASALDAALLHQRSALSMLTTLVLGGSGAALLVAGFAARDALHRYLGLLAFTVALGKLALWDVWMIDRIYQIVLFIGIGGLLVAGGFLYARFGKRLVKLVREGAPAGAVLLVLLASRSARAAPPHFDVTHAEWMRAIDPVAAPGDYRVEVDLDLYRQSKSAATLSDVRMLSDVRIVDDQQREIPYDLQAINTVRLPPAVVSEFLDPGTGTDGSAVATFKMSGGPSCHVQLVVDGETFVRHARIETGDSLTDLRTVSDTGVVYRVVAPGSGSVERTDLDYPRSLAGFLRVTLAPDEVKAAPVGIRGATFSCTPTWTMPATQTLPLAIEETHVDADKKTTVVTLDAGASGAPLTALVLDVDGGEFRRNVTVSATNYRQAWPDAGSGEIYRLHPRPSVTVQSLRIPVTSDKRWFRIEIANEDSPPLTVRSVTAELPTRQIVFRAANPGNYRLLVGDPEAQAPIYDLPSILAQKEEPDRATRLALAAAIKNPRFGEQPAPPNPPFTEQHRGVIGIVLALVLGLLSLWAVRLLRKPAT